MMKTLKSFRAAPAVLTLLAMALLSSLPALSAQTAETAPAAAGKSDPVPEKNRPVTVFLSGIYPDLVISRIPAGQNVSLSYSTGKDRKLLYSGEVRERETMGAGASSTLVSERVYSVKSADLIRPLGDGLARAWLYSEWNLTRALAAGRDRLKTLRERPAGGTRVFSVRRRMAGSGLEPAAGDADLRRQFAPVPEFPRLPGVEFGASDRVVRRFDNYRITWSLIGSGKIDGKQCLALGVKVGPARGFPRSGIPVVASCELLLDANDGTVICSAGRWSTLLQGRGSELEHSWNIRLVRAEVLKPEAFEQEENRLSIYRDLLGSVSRHDGEKTRSLLQKAEKQGFNGPAVAAARMFIAAEELFKKPVAGRRRIALVPEDTYVLLGAPEQIPAGEKLIPVVFFHGASAHAKTYFDEWYPKTRKRNLLLIFPEAREWTWKPQLDGPVVGSLLEVLRHTYNLDTDRLVFAGHNAGGGFAMMMTYGANFPGYRTRAVVSAGALFPARIREMAYTRKPPELVARLRATRAFLLTGKDNKKVTRDKLMNLAKWLHSYNNDGVKIEITPGVALRYSAEWTNPILDWIQEIPAGTYAVAMHHGPYEQLSKTWSELCGQWVPKNGYLLRDTPSFEIYLNDPRSTPPEQLLTDCYAPVEKTA